MKKRAVELTLKTIAIVVLVLIVLIMSILFFTTKFNEAKKQVNINKTDVVDKMFNEIVKED